MSAIAGAGHVLSPSPRWPNPAARPRNRKTRQSARVREHASCGPDKGCRRGVWEPLHALGRQCFTSLGYRCNAGRATVVLGPDARELQEQLMRRVGRGGDCCRVWAAVIDPKWRTRGSACGPPAARDWYRPEDLASRLLVMSTGVKLMRDLRLRNSLQASNLTPATIDRARVAPSVVSADYQSRAAGGHTAASRRSRQLRIDDGGPRRQQSAPPLPTVDQLLLQFARVRPEHPVARPALHAITEAREALVGPTACSGSNAAPNPLSVR